LLLVLLRFLLLLSIAVRHVHDDGNEKESVAMVVVDNADIANWLRMSSKRIGHERD